MSDEAKVLQIAGFLRIVGEGLLSGDALRTEARELGDVAGSLLESRWIPVAERLPDRQELVLCATVGGEVGIGCVQGDYVVDVEHSVKCTHWQPLPEPPKESR